ncbi:hypothetical protein LRS06_19765 [Hymenobacter sp. J193]|uniref:hypothetical protein n=1 Tax=Hymenobacter sp. J193 TaxID=2898429 RepID=UPI002150EFDA|nr:hypothetical protein [Hymenobacter sp. J193]MCR5889968.1 hypothetical protein [Hymenobacter sp. J193]
MLDFYFIQDSQNPSSKDLFLQYGGGIKDELFYQLQAEGIIEPWFDYYGKFRWGSEIVAGMLLKLKRQPQAASLPEEREAFMAILQKAVQEGCGLMGYGD